MAARGCAETSANAAAGTARLFDNDVGRGSHKHPHITLALAAGVPPAYSAELFRGDGDSDSDVKRVEVTPPIRINCVTRRMYRGACIK
jgi:hypothetical protein